MAIKMNVALRNARLQAVVDKIDVAVTGGYIEFYDGIQPATAGGALSSNTLLGTTVFDVVSGTVATGVLTFNTISDDVSADATGTVTWCRVLDGDAGFIFDGDAGLTASSAFARFDDVNITAGDVIHPVSATITEGNA